MTTHLSSLVLDELAAGVPASEAARAHVGSCGSCQGKLEALRAERVAFVGSAPAVEQLARLQQRRDDVARAQAPAPSWLRWLWAPVAVGAVAALALFVTPPARVDPAAPTERVKGAATFELRAQRTGASVDHARVGDSVSLWFGAGRTASLAVLGVDESGHVDVVWPLNADPNGHSEKVNADDGIAQLAEFEVTPGPMVLHALVTEGDVPLDALVASVQLQVERAKNPLEVTLIAPAGVTAVLSRRLEVSK